MSQWCRKVLEIRGLSKALVLVILGLSLLVSSSLIPLHSFLPAWGHFEDSYTINPGGRSSLRIGLMSGSTIRVIVAISGGDGYISFSIQDYDGKTILSERLASEEQFFEFQPRGTGFHVLVFENNGPITQSIHWVVRIYYYDTLFQLLGVPLPILGVVMIALGGRKEKEPFAQPVAKLKVKKRPRTSSRNSDMDITLVRNIGQNGWQR